MQPGDAETVNDYLHANNILWLNLDPKSFMDSIANYYLYINFINLVGKDGNIVFTSLMDEKGKMEDIKGSSTRDQMVFDVLADKFGKVDFTPYTSTDYSRDGEVMTLQKASVGLGVDIVFMGNAFVDKDMEPGGLYEQKMQAAMEQFFAYCQDAGEVAGCHQESHDTPGRGVTLSMRHLFAYQNSKSVRVRCK